MCSRTSPSLLKLQPFAQSVANREVLLLGIYHEETRVEKDTCIPLFIGAPKPLRHLATQGCCVIRIKEFLRQPF